MSGEFMTIGDAIAEFARSPALGRALESFTPWDNIPWQAQAEQLLRCPLGSSFLGLRPASRIDEEVSALIDRLGLRSGAAVLDLGCGPGLHGNRLGARGYRVTGIDIAHPVVEHAQAHADAAGLPCAYHQLSFLDMEFEAEFDAAFLANSVFNQLGDGERIELLDRTSEALVAGGGFACELHVASEDGVRAAPEIRRLYSLAASPWTDQPHHWLERILSFPDQRQRVTHHLILGADGSFREHWSRSRLHDRRALTGEFETCGFAVRGWFDADLRTPPAPASDRVWVVAERREEDSP
jgi:SAM-dependent methyltransferase